MSKFWQKKYISKYTGAEIDAAIAKAADATKVTANPTLAGTEAALEGLQVGETKYKVGGGGGTGLFITPTDNAGAITFDKTYTEIAAAINVGIPVWIVINNDNYLVTYAQDIASPFDPTERSAKLGYFTFGMNSVSAPYTVSVTEHDYFIDNHESVTYEEYTVTVTGT